MVDPHLPIYQHPTPIWDAETCAKLAKRTAKDSLGTPYPFKGYIGESQWGVRRYNGGCIRDGEWWQGENFPLPKVAPGYEIIRIPTWGYRIIKT